MQPSLYGCKQDLLKDERMGVSLKCQLFLTPWNRLIVFKHDFHSLVCALAYLFATVKLHG